MEPEQLATITHAESGGLSFLALAAAYTAASAKQASSGQMRI
jgi:hypothetical protein